MHFITKKIIIENVSHTILTVNPLTNGNVSATPLACSCNNTCATRASYWLNTQKSLHTSFFHSLRLSIWLEKSNAKLYFLSNSTYLHICAHLALKFCTKTFDFITISKNMRNLLKFQHTRRGSIYGTVKTAPEI